MDAFAEHENGQLRIEAAGEQRSLLPIPDDEIPTAPADPMSALELERFARDHMVISIRTFDRHGVELETRRFSGAGDDDVEAFGSLANAEVAATEYENHQRAVSAFEERSWIVDRSYG